ncbi:hypothetical protein ACFQT0_29190 [Hymenobacter humi]|uniref:Uncharacterized protein n=1 Tax=Hymenobacter humi TaxID=1411620 RepID=A0ABW2UFC7_9BACT
MKQPIGYIREVPILSPGGFLVLGVNRVNVGLALGADFTFGSAARVWIYQGKPGWAWCSAWICCRATTRSTCDF